MNRPFHADGTLHGVVVACRRSDGRFMLIRRSALVAAPGMICFPGGGIEPGESPEAAACREMREELGLEVQMLRPRWHWVSPHRPLTLWGFAALLPDAQPRPCPEEVAQVLWLSPEEILAHPDALPGTDAFVQCLLQNPLQAAGEPAPPQPVAVTAAAAAPEARRG